MAYNWEKNTSTGDHIARVNENTRLIRLRGGGLYLAEFWGDYSLNYPISTGAYTTPKAALKALKGGLTWAPGENYYG